MTKKNILKKLGVITKDIPQKNELKKKRGRGRPARVSNTGEKLSPAEKQVETSNKKKGKPGRPKKRGPKKGSKRKTAPELKPVEAKVPVAKAAVVKPAAKKVAKKAKPANKSAVKAKKAVAEPKQDKAVAVKARPAPVKKASIKKQAQWPDILKNLGIDKVIYFDFNENFPEKTD